MESYTYLLKFLIVGNAAVGKTCLLRWFLEKKFKHGSTHTIGVEFGTKVVHVDGKSVKLQIWDTAGQERFQCVTRSYYRGAIGALIVYDVNDRTSFNAVSHWITSVRDMALPNVTIILVGNKIDVDENYRQVTQLDGEQCAKDNGVHTFIETSAYSGKNVQDAFYTAVRAILASDSISQINDPFPMNTALPHSLTTRQNNQSSSQKCC